MDERKKLSPAQNRVLHFIESEIARSGRPPTYRDIAAHCGYDAVGTVQDHVKALLHKGFLEKEPGRARGLRLAHHNRSVGIPILGSVPAGNPMEAIEETQGTIPYPTDSRSQLFALKVKGESMIEAGILDGDFVIVRKDAEARDGDIVVALLDGEATVKTLEKRQGRVRLLPANPRFQPIELDRYAENIIQGKVVGLQRYY